MATKDKEQKKGKGGDKRTEAAKPAHAGVGKPAPAPRLHAY
jgi:hypothetical protein